MQRAIWEQWGTIREADGRDDATRVCLWNTRADAIEGRDPDERVCRVRVEVLEILE